MRFWIFLGKGENKGRGIPFLYFLNHTQTRCLWISKCMKSVSLRITVMSLLASYPRNSERKRKISRFNSLIAQESQNAWISKSQTWLYFMYDIEQINYIEWLKIKIKHCWLRFLKTFCTNVTKWTAILYTSQIASVVIPIKVSQYINLCQRIFLEP